MGYVIGYIMLLTVFSLALVLVYYNLQRRIDEVSKMPGPPGRDGYNGRDGMLSVGPPGSWGATGPQGLQGLKGEPGMSQDEKRRLYAWVNSISLLAREVVTAKEYARLQEMINSPDSENLMLTEELIKHKQHG